MNRVSTLHQASSLLEQLSKCPDLDEGAKMMKKAMSEGEVPSWLKGLPVDNIESSAEAHLRTLHSMRDKESWCLVAAPYDVTGPPIDIAALDATALPDQKRKGNQPVRPRTAHWANGEDTESSLWWVSFATQPSKYSSPDNAPLMADADDAMADAYADSTGITALRAGVEGGVKEEEAARRARVDAQLGIVNGSELLKKVARDVLSAPRRFQHVQEYCQAEKKRTDSLSTVYTEQVLAMRIQARYQENKKLLT